MPKLYLDLDGVLADFDVGYEALTGQRPDKEKDNVDWELVRAAPVFYENLPPMPGMEILWARCAPLKPTILTGVPHTVPEAPANKEAWVRKHLGPDVPVICCRSSEKWKHCQLGDILCDDWTRYRHLWLAAGGRWITHRSAMESIQRLDVMLAGTQK